MGWSESNLQCFALPNKWILKEYLNQHNLDTYIEADGGINLDTIDEVKESGVDIAVVGNGILKTENYRTTVSKLKN